MNADYRFGSALRRMGAAVGARLVRFDDVQRIERNGVEPGELHSRMAARADDAERQALRLEGRLAPVVAPPFDPEQARAAAADAI